MTVERNRGLFGAAAPKENSNNTISRLCAVLSSAGKKYFVGWNIAGLPIIGEKDVYLSREAQESYSVFAMSGNKPRSVLFNQQEVSQFEVVTTGVDIPDQGRRLTKDLIRIGVTDSSGTKKDLTFDELTILSGIVDAIDNPWNDVSSLEAGDVVEPKTLYTLVAPTVDQIMRGQSASVVLFEVLSEGKSNEAQFKFFIFSAIKLLCKIDAKQPPEMRKGYIDAASEIGIGGVQKKDWISRLQDRGFIKPGDDKAKILRGVLRTALKDYIKPEYLEKMASIPDDAPDYVKINMEDLSDLVRAMKNHAEQKFRRNP